MPQWSYPWNSSSAAPSVVPLNLGPDRQWVKVGKGLVYSAFSAAALTNKIALFSLPAAVLCSAVKIQATTAFAGPAVTGCTVSVGDVSNALLLSGALNVLQASGPTVYQLTDELVGESTAAAVQIYAYLTTVGANISVLTAGVVSIWAELATVK